MKKILSAVAILAIMFILIGDRAISLAATIPYVETAGTASVSSNSAVLTATVNPAGDDTTLWFEYGTTSNFGQLTTQLTVPSGNSQGNYTITLSGLTAGTTYYFRAVARNSYGTVYGQQRSFQTPSDYFGTGAPSISTNAVENYDATTANLKAYATAQDIQSEAWFEYGTDAANLNLRTPSVIVQTASYYSGNNSTPFVQYQVTNLSPNTAYSYRAVIRNFRGTGYGQILTFRTNGSSGGYYGGTTSYGLPIVTSNDPSAILVGGANLSGSANPNGSAAWGWFEYGVNQSLGSKTPEVSLGSGNSTVPFSYQVSSLIPGGLYYQRAAARNNAGTTYGPLTFFRTWENNSYVQSDIPPVRGGGTVYAPEQPTYNNPGVSYGNNGYNNTYNNQQPITNNPPSQANAYNDYYYGGYTNGWVQQFAVYSANLNKVARAEMNNPLGSAADNSNGLAQVGSIITTRRMVIFNVMLAIFVIAITVFALRLRRN